MPGYERGSFSTSVLFEDIGTGCIRELKERTSISPVSLFAMVAGSFGCLPFDRVTLG